MRIAGIGKGVFCGLILSILVVSFVFILAFGALKSNCCAFALKEEPRNNMLKTKNTK
jgi:hypothetical protein